MPKEQEVKAESPVLTADQLVDVIKAVTAGTIEEQEERETKKRQKEARRANWLKERAEFERVARFKYEFCIDGTRHHKQHPYENQHTIGGQLNNDMLVHPLCIKCQSEFPPFKAEFLQGNDLRDINNLTVAMIEMWAKESGTDVAVYRFEKKPEAKTA